MTLNIVALLPALQNTNGDAENAAVLAKRAEWAGLDARVVRVDSRDDLPARVDAIVLGSGSDSSIEAGRAALLTMHDELRTWGTEGVPILAIGSDVRDPSYFWPTDASSLGRVAIVSGSKADEAALMLAYDGVQIDRVEPDLGRALDDFLAAPAPAAGVKTIVFTADAMRRTRAFLGLTGAE